MHASSNGTPPRLTFPHANTSNKTNEQFFVNTCQSLFGCRKKNVGIKCLSIRNELVPFQGQRIRSIFIKWRARPLGRTLIWTWPPALQQQTMYPCVSYASPLILSILSGPRPNYKSTNSLNSKTPIGELLFNIIRIRKYLKYALPCLRFDICRQYLWKLASGVQL